MNSYEAFLAYRDRYGLNQLTITNGVADVSQNGALFTMEYLICLLEDDSVSEEIKLQEVQRLIPVYGSLENPYGITRRTPDSLEQDSMDNMGAIASFSGCFGDGNLVKRIKAQGEYVEANSTQDSGWLYALARVVTGIQLSVKSYLWPSWTRSSFRPKFYWNTQSQRQFSVESWFGRSPGFLGLLDVAAKAWTTPLRFLGVLIGQFLGCFVERGNTDARKLPYVNWYFLVHGTSRYQAWFWKIFYKLWVFILLKQYPNGMRDVYAMYYGDPAHPIRTKSKRYFGEKT